MLSPADVSKGMQVRDQHRDQTLCNPAKGDRPTISQAPHFWLEGLRLFILHHSAVVATATEPRGAVHPDGSIRTSILTWTAISYHADNCVGITKPSLVWSQLCTHPHRGLYLEKVFPRVRTR
jgi:hypothetical protein